MINEGGIKIQLEPKIVNKCRDLDASSENLMLLIGKQAFKAVGNYLGDTKNGATENGVELEILIKESPVGLPS